MKTPKTLESWVADIFRMSEETWARHSNPWSVWTRFTALPILVVAVWSGAAIGAWAWILVLPAVLWIWLNPRIFKKPISTNNWASKAVLGERVWLNRKAVEVPRRHRLAPNLLSILSSAGLPFLLWGLWTLTLWPTAFGMLLVYAGKVWFLDRMVWLYEDVKDSNPQYSGWLY